MSCEDCEAYLEESERRIQKLESTVTDLRIRSSDLRIRSLELKILDLRIRSLELIAKQSENEYIVIPKLKPLDPELLRIYEEYKEEQWVTGDFRGKKNDHLQKAYSKIKDLESLPTARKRIENKSLVSSPLGNSSTTEVLPREGELPEGN